jgi:hypothetical protein
MRPISICVLAIVSLAWSVSSQSRTHQLWRLLTRDTATRLDWLDVDLTAGISYDAIQGGAGGYISQGWRYASGNEIDALATTLHRFT